MFRTLIAISVFCFVGLLAIQNQSLAQQTLKETKWKGFKQVHFKVNNRNAYLVSPPKALDGNPWIWRARFPGYHAEMDVKLIEKGFHVGYVDVAGMFGSPKAIEIGDAYYEKVTSEFKLSRKVALEGVSRGGLLVYNWAAKNPDKVAAIYCDTPVMDFKSWPGGKGNGLGAKREWTQCQKAYEFENESTAIAYLKNPIDHAKVLSKAKIPLLHIVSENDKVVPPKENTYVLRDRLKELGYKLEVISLKEGTKKSNGHHFKHPAVDEVVEFLFTNGTTASKPRE